MTPRPPTLAVCRPPAWWRSRPARRLTSPGSSPATSCSRSTARWCATSSGTRSRPTSRTSSSRCAGAASSSSCWSRRRRARRSGLDLASAVFDRVRTCDNHCPFCFIYQLPTGMRRSLSLKDDDYRLSFLYGNFTTLTRFTEADLERVITEQLSPLYVSIHATDPDVRARLLRNRRGATSLRWLAALLDAGIEVHGQVVVCPGHQRRRRARRHAARRARPVPRASPASGSCRSASATTPPKPEMRRTPSPRPSACSTSSTEWQARFADALGRRLVFAADEYYLLAERPFPALDAYDGLPQHENGIGMARQFEQEVRAALARARRSRSRAPAPASSPGSTAPRPRATARPDRPELDIRELDIRERRPSGVTPIRRRFVPVLRTRDPRRWRSSPASTAPGCSSRSPMR